MQTPPPASRPAPGWQAPSSEQVAALRAWLDFCALRPDAPTAIANPSPRQVLQQSYRVPRPPSRKPHGYG
ncbi:MAG: hypothetical protein ACPGVO_23875 [Spirulinaceae cyanobacterium]